MKITYLTINHFNPDSWINSYKYLIKNNKKEVLVEFKDYFSEIFKKFYNEKFDLESEIQKNQPEKGNYIIDDGFIKFAYLCKDAKISMKLIDGFYFELGLPHIYPPLTKLTDEQKSSIYNKIDPVREEYMKKNILKYMKKNNEAIVVMHPYHVSNISKSIKNIDQEIVSFFI